MADKNTKKNVVDPALAQSDLENRLKSCNAEIVTSLGKYKLGLGAVPIILEDGRLAAKPQLFDYSNPPKEDDKKEELSKSK